MVIPVDAPIEATGSIRFFNAGPADGNVITIVDGNGTTVLFEMDDNASVTAGSIPVIIASDKKSSAINLASAINNSVLQIRAEAKNEAVLLTSKIAGSIANVSISEDGVGIDATGMEGGADNWSNIVGNTPFAATGGTVARSASDRARYYAEDSGAVGDGVTDDTAAIRLAILWCSYAARDGINRFDTLHFKSAHYKITGTLTLNQGISLQGNGMLDGGTRILFDGGETESAIVVTPEQSGVGVYDLMVEDVRTVKTAGYGVKMDRCVNYCACERVQANFFPSAGIFVGSSVGGSAGDCMRVRDCWVTSHVAGSNGVEVTNVDNTVIIEGILSDQSGGGAVIRIHGVANDQASVRISDIKHEAQDVDTATIDVVYPNYGNLSIFNIIQRTPMAATAAPVIRTSGTAGGKGVRLYGVSGDDHSEWGVDAPTLYDGVTGNEVHSWEPITGMIAPSGRAVRTLSGDGSPAGLIYGNPGDTYTRTDGTSQNPTFWTKSYGDGTTTGWLPVWPSFDEDAVWAPTIANGAVGTFAFPVTNGPAFVGFHVSVALSPGVPNGVLVSSGIGTNGVVSIVIRNAAEAHGSREIQRSACVCRPTHDRQSRQRLGVK